MNKRSDEVISKSYINKDLLTEYKKEAFKESMYDIIKGAIGIIAAIGVFIGVYVSTYNERDIYLIRAVILIVTAMLTIAGVVYSVKRICRDIEDALEIVRNNIEAEIRRIDYIEMYVDIPKYNIEHIDEKFGIVYQTLKNRKCIGVQYSHYDETDKPSILDYKYTPIKEENIENE